MSKKDLIIKELETYETKTLPIGTYRTIALKIGAHKLYVRMVAKEQGYAVHGYKSEAKTLCYRCVCGKIQKSDKLCFNCRWIELPCEQCGTLVKKRAALLVWQYKNYFNRIDTNQPAWKAGTFCSKRCQGAYMGLRNKKARNE